MKEKVLRSGCLSAAIKTKDHYSFFRSKQLGVLPGIIKHDALLNQGKTQYSKCGK